MVGGGIEPPTHGFSVVVSLRSERQSSNDDIKTYENSEAYAATLAQQLAQWITDCPLPCVVDVALEDLIDGVCDNLAMFRQGK